MTDAKANMAYELFQFNMSWNDKTATASNQLSQRLAAEFKLELKLVESTLKWQADNLDEHDLADPFEHIRSKLDEMKKETAKFESFSKAAFSDDVYHAAIAAFSRARQSGPTAYQ